MVKQKKDLVRMQLGVALTLPRMLLMFKTPTYGDMKRIDGLMKIFNEQEQNQGVAIKAFFEKHGLNETDSIDSNHSLFNQFQNDVLGSEVDVTKAKTAVFTQDQLNNAVDGLSFNYQERSMLQFWLVKEK